MFEPAGTETQQRQAIVDALHALTNERVAIIAAASKEVDAKREALVAQCAALGHVYVPASIGFAINGIRQCAICGVRETRFPELDLAASAGIAAPD